MMYQLDLSRDFPRRVFTLMVVIQLVLVIIYAVLLIFSREETHSFTLDGEGSVPVWYSSIQLFGIAVVLQADDFQHYPISQFAGRFLKYAGIGFILLSLDKSAAIHEAIDDILDLAGLKSALMGSRGKWIVVYALIGLGFLIWGRKAIGELYNLFRKEMKISITGFAMLVFGSVVLDTLVYLLHLKAYPSIYKSEVALEEYLEMLGAGIIFLGVTKALVKCRELKEHSLAGTN